MYKHFFKRFLDVLLSGVALLCIGWLILIVALWLHFANKGAGAFFRQVRVGKDEKWGGNVWGKENFCKNLCRCGENVGKTKK